MFNPSRYFLRKMHELKNNEYLKSMKPILFLMRMISALPINVRPQKEIPYFISSRLVSSLAITTYIMMHIKFGGYVVLDVILDDSITNIITIVAKGPEICCELLCFAAPLIMWRRSKEMQDYWDAWGNFQLKYESISGAPLTTRKRRYIKITILICVTWIALRCSYAAWFHYSIFTGIWEFASANYLQLEVYTLATYWFTNCAYIRLTSEEILILGKKIITEKKEDYKLNRIILLWLNLNDLAKHFVEAHSFLFLSLFILDFIAILGDCYAMLNYSTYEDVYPISHFCDVLSLFVAILSIVCIAAHSVHLQVFRRQKEALLQENIMRIEHTALKSMVRYLQTISLKNSIINLNGFIRLNRMELPVIILLCIDYLIVLRQFSDN